MLGAVFLFGGGLHEDTKYKESRMGFVYGSTLILVLVSIMATDIANGNVEKSVLTIRRILIFGTLLAQWVGAGLEECIREIRTAGEYIIFYCTAD